MIKKVVVPLGGFYPGEGSIELAHEFALRMGATVELLTVATEGTEQAELEALVDIADRHGGVATARVATERDSVAQTIVEETDDADTLVCVVSAGHNAMTVLIEGSPSEELVRSSRQPLVVVGPHATVRRTGTQLAVALDGTAEAEAILPHAQSLAAQLGLSLLLVQVVPPTGPSEASGPPAAAYESNYLINVAHRLDPTRRLVNWDTLHDDNVARALSDLSRRDDIAMIALATHGLHAIDRILLGATTFKLIKTAECPLYTWHPHTEDRRSITYRPAAYQDASKRAGKVVVGVSGTTSAAVIEWASNEAVSRNARLEIVHCWQYPYVVSMHGEVVPMATIEDRDEQIDRVVGRAAEVALAIDRDLPVDVVVTTTSFPIEALVDASDGAELLVVGRHEQSAVERFMLGSVSAACVRRSTCPVAVVPTAT